MNMNTYISVIKYSSVQVAQAVVFVKDVESERADCLYKLSVYLHKLSNQLNQNYRSALRYLQPDEQIDLLSYYYKEMVNCLHNLSLPINNELVLAHQNLINAHQNFKNNLVNGQIDLLELNLIEEAADYYSNLAKVIGNYYLSRFSISA